MGTGIWRHSAAGTESKQRTITKKKLLTRDWSGVGFAYFLFPLFFFPMEHDEPGGSLSEHLSTGSIMVGLRIDLDEGVEWNHQTHNNIRRKIADVLKDRYSLALNQNQPEGSIAIHTDTKSTLTRIVFAMNELIVEGTGMINVDLSIARDALWKIPAPQEIHIPMKNLETNGAPV